MEFREVHVRFWIPKPSRKWLQFSVRTFVILSLAAGVGLGWLGMRIKHQRDEAREWRRIYTRVYNVAELVMPPADGDPPVSFDALITEIESTIAPDSWESAGGRGAIAPFETNLSLVVSQKEEVHHELATFLESRLGRPVNDFRAKRNQFLRF